MKRYDPDQPLISIHIPKCAGSSFSQVLKAWFGRGLLRHYYDERRDLPPPIHRTVPYPWERLARRRICIHGHFNRTRGIGPDAYYPDVDQFITVLRDPFDVHVSRYFYVKREITLNRWLQRSGKPHPMALRDETLERFLKRARKSHLLSFFPEELTRESFPEVLEKRFVFVGIAEQLQLSVDVLARFLGRPRVQVPTANESEWDEPIPPGAREEFRMRNALAYDIYDYARKRLEESAAEIS